MSAAVPEEVLSLEVACTREGCGWRGELGTIKQTCPYEPVLCACGEKVQRGKLEAHQQQDCRLRRHTCVLCGETVFVMGDHLRVCPEVVVHCTNDECCTTLKRKEAVKHQKECPHRMIRCTNKCGKEVTSIALPSHLEHKCPKRIVTCSYCKEKEGTYVFVTGDHLHDCPDHPLPCVNEGCQENVKRRDMLGHCYQHCLHQITGCGNGCGQDMKRQELAEHEASRCPRRIMTCAHCEKRDVGEFILGDHVRKCPEVRIPCHNEDCLEVIKRYNVDEHQDTCPHGLVSCPYSSIGCYSAIKRRDLVQHKTRNTDRHLSLAIDHIFVQEQSLTSRANQCEKQLLGQQIIWEREKLDLTHRLDHMTNRVDQCERRVSEQKRDLEEEKQNRRQRARFDTREPTQPNQQSNWKSILATIVCVILIIGFAVAPETIVQLIMVVLVIFLMFMVFMR